MIFVYGDNSKYSRFHLIIQNIFKIVQISKEKQFTRGRTPFLKAENYIKVSIEISTNMPKVDPKNIMCEALLVISLIETVFSKI